MLVGTVTQKVSKRRWRAVAWFSAFILGVCALSVAPHLSSSTELVRMRNALLLLDPAPGDFAWTPDNVPANYMQERGAPDPVFVAAAAGMGLAQLPSDWDRVLVISRHLLSNPSLIGAPIQSDLRDTYRHIINIGDGYCGDFNRVFVAFSLAVGIPVRSWAFSFDGFDGSGHIWPEIWNRDVGKWQLVDVFNNYYFHRGDGVAVSAAEFREALSTTPRSLYRSHLSAGARPGYVIEEKMWAYYERGLPEWYMVWGNNVFSYDAFVAETGIGSLPRSLEQLGGVLTGAYPGIKLLKTDMNRSQVGKLRRLRMQLFVTAIASMMAMALLLASAYFLHRNRTQNRTKA